MSSESTNNNVLCEFFVNYDLIFKSHLFVVRLYNDVYTDLQSDLYIMCQVVVIWS